MLLLAAAAALLTANCVLGVQELASRCVNPGQVALTFEGGPDAQFTPMILDALKMHNASATFFIRASRLQGWNEIAAVKRAIKEGHTIGFLLEPEWEQQKDLDRDSLGNSIAYHLDVIRKAVGRRPKYIRASHANTTAKFGDLMNSNGYIATQPSLDTLDIQGQTALRAIINGVRQGANDIVKLHDWFPTTANCAKDIVSHLAVNLGLKMVDIVNCTGMAYGYSEEDKVEELGNGVADRPLDFDGGLFAPKDAGDKGSVDKVVFNGQIVNSAPTLSPLSSSLVAVLIVALLTILNY